MSFETALAFVLKWEKERSDDPRDPGGLTKWGIASHYYPQVLSATFSIEEAEAIYKNKYWDACKCGELPGAVAFMLFDAAVNQGQANAIRFLQKSLKVAADGILGPETMAAAQSASLVDLLSDLAARRAFAYAMNPQVQFNGLGWFRRMMECYQAAMALSAQDNSGILARQGAVSSSSPSV